MRKTIFFMIIVAVLVSCGQKKQLSKEEYFQTVFIKKFKSLELPCTLPHAPLFKPNEFSSTAPATQDSLITGKSSVVCYGVIRSNPNFYTLIFYGAAATMIPVIQTYHSDGTLIETKSIDFGCWGGGVPYEYFCEGSTKIDSDYKINIKHVITCKDCDSLSSSPIKYYSRAKGSISSSGIINLEAMRDSIQ